MNQPKETPQVAADKLTIEELAPYLPYGLEFVNTENTDYSFLLHEVSRGFYTLWDDDSGLEIIQFGEETHLKPLLIPLPDLIPEMAEWATAIKDKDNYATKWDFKRDLKEYFKEPLSMPYFICQKIFSLHGDLFNLIGRGLVVNKLNYK